MFSEYASRFLAQSQSRITNFVQPESAGGDASRKVNDRYRRGNYSTRNPSDKYSQIHGNPYQSVSHLSRLNFTSRYAPASDAPLFHSALDDFREEDDAEERERETADFFALQRSRRVFASSRVQESSETDREGSNPSIDGSDAVDRRDINGRGRARGIQSSWNGSGKRSIAAKITKHPAIGQEGSSPTEEYLDGSTAASGHDKGKMVDIGLGSGVRDSLSPDDLAVDLAPDDSPPAFQRFRSGPIYRSPADLKHSNQDGDLESGLGVDEVASQPPPSVADTNPPMTLLAEAPKHDVFWGSLFLICLGALFATFFLVFLHTSTSERNIGDTIYSTLRASLHLFAVDTVVSIVVSLVWLALLRSFVRPLVYLILFAVPAILFSFSLYSFTASFKGPAGGSGLQDKAMRWFSSVPGVFALVWLYTIYQGRYSLTKAIAILDFASRILTANPALVTLGFGTLAAVITWTWMWLGMFTRVFLGGEMSRSLAKFVIDATSWWLGVYFVMMYIWTLSVIGGIQRSTTAATISQWYYHRNIVSGPSSRDIVTAAFIHAMTTIFGTICYSTLVALLIRLPILLLPRRFARLATAFFHSLVPATITSFTNPLTLTYAAIHSQPLQISARGLSQLTFSGPQVTMNTRGRSSFSRPSGTTPLLPYRLAKLILHATRFIMAMALGFGGWVATARQLSITMPDGPGVRGSAYAYVVGLVAGFIGWGVLGAMEGVLSGIVDAAVICWRSEKNMAGGGAYCLEAECLFGEGQERP